MSVHAVTVSPWFRLPNQAAEVCMVSIDGWAQTTAVTDYQLACQATDAQRMALRAAKIAATVQSVQAYLAEEGERLA